MGRIPVALGNNLKSDKDLTLVCRQYQESGTPNKPWTHGKWVSIYHDIANAIMEAPDSADYLNPSLIVKQYLNKDHEGVIVTSSKKGLKWLEALINAKVTNLRVTS